TRIKVADLAVTDDALGSEVFSLSGAHAGLFEIDGASLYLKAGVALDFEQADSYSVTILVDDPSVGGAVDASAEFVLGVSDVNEAPPNIILGNAVEEIEERDRPDPANASPGAV